MTNEDLDFAKRNLQIGELVRIDHHEHLGIMEVAAIRNDGILCESQQDAEIYHVEVFPLHWVKKCVTDPKTGMWIPPKPESDAGVM